MRVETLGIAMVREKGHSRDESLSPHLSGWYYLSMCW